MLNMEEKFETNRGSPTPFGATQSPDGINFSIFSKHAYAVSLCLFLPMATRNPEDEKPFVEIPLDSNTNKTGSVWHIFIYNLPSNYRYGYRVTGPYDPVRGHYFDNRLILLDPYSRQISSPSKWGTGKQRETKRSHKGEVYPIEFFNWEGDTHPNFSLRDLIIYEMHVRGFTQDPSSGVNHPGTFEGIVEKIPYLKSIGVNAVELMPIHEFDELNNHLHNPETKHPLYNYWGYSTVNFFSLMNRYGTHNKNVISEFKELVKALHANGIEVILDVVYNHTGEGNIDGPILSFKGLENTVYYMLAPNGDYYNFSGCGNTFNCNHPVVRELIHDS